MKKTLSQRFFLPLCLLTLFGILGGSHAWAEAVTATITFSNSNVKISGDSVTGDDSQGNTWQITTVGTISFTPSKDYCQIGSSSKPATSITFTTTLSSDVTVTNFSAKFGGFKSTAGNISLMVGDTKVGAGSLKASSDVTVTSTSSAAGKVLKVTVTNIAKGVKCYNISVTYEQAASKISFPENSDKEMYADEIASFVSPVLQGAESTDVITYVSSNEALATVASDGTVSIAEGVIGTAKITATGVDASSVSIGSDSYTITVNPCNIKQIKSLVTGTSSSTANSFKAKFTNAKVTYVNGNNAFLQDDEAGILIYKGSHGLNAGDCFNGEVKGTTFKYNGLREINSFDFSAATKTTVEVPAPTEVTLKALSENFDDYENMYCVVKEVTAGGNISASGSSCTISQVVEGTQYTANLYASAAINVTSGNKYDIIVFPGVNSSKTPTDQLRCWTDDHITKVSGTQEMPTAAFGSSSYTMEIGESKDLTFETNSDGEITYTFVPSTGLTLTKTEAGVKVEAAATGTYTITASVAETALFTSTSIDCQLTVTKKDPAAAFSATSYQIEYNGDITLPFSQSGDGEVSYSVSPSDENIVFEKVAEGCYVVVGTTPGTYTVTATVAETTTYQESTATCELKVVAPAANISPKVVYRKVTSTDDIVDGGVYLLFCESKGEAMSDITDASKYRISSVAATFSTDANGVTYYEGDVNVTGKPYEITVQRASNGTYNLLHANGKYINGKSDTDLGFSDTGSAGWSFYFVPATGNVQISNTGKAGNYLQRNGNGDYNYFKNYAGGQSTSQLYQKVGEISVAKAVDGYSTYVADFAYVMPAELKGYAVALAAKEDAIITELAYDAEAEVPSLTPLLIKTSETYGEEENVKTYYPAVLNKEVSAYSEDNYLEYQRAADGATTKTMKSGSVYYYKLTRNSEGKAGFYWGATNGAAFAMTKGSTAYLTVPQSMVLPIQGFVIDGNGETTGIDTVESETEKAAVYNLQGIRMTGAKLPKGVYISNGKKFMVK